MSHSLTKPCAGCGIPNSDGYTLGCQTCVDRRTGRLLRGIRYSPTGYAGEAIDNEDPRGRIVAHSF